MEQAFLSQSLTILQYTAAFMVTMFIIIGIHELGHFVVARACKIKVLNFSIGVGTKILKRTSKNGTEYSLSLLPVGGYVKMLDEEEMDKEELEVYTEEELKQSFNRANRAKKMAVVAAGPFFNFLLAIVMFTAVNMHGVMDIKPYVGSIQNSKASGIIQEIDGKMSIQSGDVILSVEGNDVENWMNVFMELTAHIGDKDLVEIKLDREGVTKVAKLDLSGLVFNKENQDILSTVGIIPTLINYGNTVESIHSDTPLGRAGLQKQDTITLIDGLSINNFYEVKKAVEESKGNSLKLTVLRDDQLIDFEVTPVLESDVWKIGFSPNFIEINTPIKEQVYSHKYGPVESVARAYDQTLSTTEFTLRFIKKLVTGNVSPTMIAGPIGIAEVAGKTAEQGLTQFLQFIALLSVNIMVMNLMPIPALDGGHLAKYSVEAITKKKLSQKSEKVLYGIGVAILLSLMCLGIFSDIINRI